MRRYSLSKNNLGFNSNYNSNAGEGVVKSRYYSLNKGEDEGRRNSMAKMQEFERLIGDVKRAAN